MRNYFIFNINDKISIICTGDTEYDYGIVYSEVIKQPESNIFSREDNYEVFLISENFYNFVLVKFMKHANNIERYLYF